MWRYKHIYIPYHKISFPCLQSILQCHQAPRTSKPRPRAMPMKEPKRSPPFVLLSKAVLGDTTLQNKHPFASLVVKKKRYEKICHHVCRTLTAFPAPKLSSHTNDPEMPGMDLPPHTTQATPVVLLCPPCIRKVSNIWDHQTRFKYCSHMSCIVGTCQSFYELICNGELTSLLKALRKIT